MTFMCVIVDMLIFQAQGFLLRCHYVASLVPHSCLAGGFALSILFDKVFEILPCGFSHDLNVLILGFLGIQLFLDVQDVMVLKLEWKLL